MVYYIHASGNFGHKQLSDTGGVRYTNANANVENFATVNANGDSYAGSTTSSGAIGQYDQTNLAQNWSSSGGWTAHADDNGYVYFGGASVSKNSQADGTTSWSVSPTQTTFEITRLSTGEVICAQAGGVIEKRSDTDGSLISSATLANGGVDVRGIISLSDDSLVASSFDSKLYFLDSALSTTSTVDMTVDGLGKGQTITRDVSDNVFVATNNGVGKYDSTGANVWTAFAGSGNIYLDISAHNDGSCFLAAFSEYDIIKLNSDGTEAWRTDFGTYTRGAAGYPQIDGYPNEWTASSVTKSATATTTSSAGTPGTAQGSIVGTATATTTSATGTPGVADASVPATATSTASTATPGTASGTGTKGATASTTSSTGTPGTVDASVPATATSTASTATPGTASATPGGVSTATTTTSSGTPGTVSVVTSTIAPEGDYRYGTDYNTLYKYDTAGVVSWSVDVDADATQVKEPVTDYARNVYLFDDSDNELISYDRNGSERWRNSADVGGAITHADVWEDGQLYVTDDISSGTTYLKCFDTDTGSKLWQYNLSAASADGVSVDKDGNAYVAEANDNLHKLDSAGTSVWTKSFTTSGSGVNYPRADNSGNIYVFVDNSLYEVHDVDQTATKIGGYASGVSIYEHDIDDSGNFYTGIHDGTDYRIEKLDSTFTALWSVIVPGDANGITPTPHDTVYVGLHDAGVSAGKIYELDDATGSTNWTHTTTGVEAYPAGFPRYSSNPNAWTPLSTASASATATPSTATPATAVGDRGMGATSTTTPASGTPGTVQGTRVSSPTATTTASTATPRTAQGTGIAPATATVTPSTGTPGTATGDGIKPSTATTTPATGTPGTASATARNTGGATAQTTSATTVQGTAQATPKGTPTAVTTQSTATPGTAPGVGTASVTATTYSSTATPGVVDTSVPATAVTATSTATPGTAVGTRVVDAIGTTTASTSTQGTTTGVGTASVTATPVTATAVPGSVEGTGTKGASAVASTATTTPGTAIKIFRRVTLLTDDDYNDSVLGESPSESDINSSTSESDIGVSMNESDINTSQNESDLT